MTPFAEDEAADTDWERRTTLLELPIEVMDEPPAFPALLVGDKALPYGRETALLSRDRWARCCCREIPPEEGGGDCSIVAEALLCRCLSTMAVWLYVYTAKV